jgi:heme oxygenase (biliverdin-IX-beta and delta-forming)
MHGPARCERLIDDLIFLGIERSVISGAPVMARPAPVSDVARWGVDYVLHGASLGGRALARQLDHLVGAGEVAGRRFLVGDGAASGQSWRCFIDQLEHAVSSGTNQAVACEAASRTFEQFETWMNTVVSARVQTSKD